MFQTSSFDIWRQEEATYKILTLIKDLDDTLQGGIPLRMITELCGAPGSGKTQLCLQLSINVQFPQFMGGLGGKALYVDTNQDFNPTRLKEIAIYAEQRFKKNASRINSHRPTVDEFNVKSILKNITYTYCANHVQLMATIINLRQQLVDEPTIKLIIIDSFAFPIRRIENVTERTGIIYDMLTEMHKLASEYKVAFVITNELTTRSIGDTWTVCPALGDSHAHKINQRIILRKEYPDAQLVALVDKSMVSPKLRIPFQIKESGLRGCSRSST